MYVCPCICKCNRRMPSILLKTFQNRRPLEERTKTYTFFSTHIRWYLCDSWCLNLNALEISVVQIFQNIIHVFRIILNIIMYYLLILADGQENITVFIFLLYEIFETCYLLYIVINIEYICLLSSWLLLLKNEKSLLKYE